MIEWLANNALSAAALGIVVAVYCRLGKPSASTRHLLWLTVIVTLLMPRWVNWPWSIELSRPTATTVRSALDQSHASGTSGIETPLRWHAVDLVEWYKHSRPIDPALQSPAHVELTAIAPRFANPVAAIDADASSHSIDPLRIAGYIWAGGSAVMFVWLLIQILCAARLVAGGRRAPRRLVEEFAAAARSMGVAPPRVVMVRRAVSPAVVCLGKPVLIWPRWVNRRLGAEERAAIVRHELAHLRRRDHWVGWLSAIAACLWWPHPMYWIARRQVLDAAELAADAWAASTDRHDRRRYAQALLTVVERVARTTGPLAPVGAAGASRRLLERRLLMVMNGTGSARLSRPAALGALLLAAAAAPGWAQFSPDQQPPADIAPPAAPLPPSPANVPQQVQFTQPSQIAQPRPTVRVVPGPSGDVLYVQAEPNPLLQSRPLPATRPARVRVVAPNSPEHIAQLQQQIEALSAQLAELKQLTSDPAYNELRDELHIELPDHLDAETRALIDAQVRHHSIQAAQLAADAAQQQVQADVLRLQAEKFDFHHVEPDVDVDVDTDVNANVNADVEVEIENDDKFNPARIRIDGVELTEEQARQIERLVERRELLRARGMAEAERRRAEMQEVRALRRHEQQVQRERALLDAGLQVPNADVPSDLTQPVHPVHPVGPVHPVHPVAPVHIAPPVQPVQPPQPISPDQAPQAAIQLDFTQPPQPAQPVVAGRGPRGEVHFIQPPQPAQPGQPRILSDVTFAPRPGGGFNSGAAPVGVTVPDAAPAELLGEDVLVQSAPGGAMISRFYPMSVQQAAAFADYLGRSTLAQRHPISIRVLGGDQDPNVRFADGPREGLMVMTTASGQQAIQFAIEMMQLQNQQSPAGDVTAPAPAPVLP